MPKAKKVLMFISINYLTQ